MIKGGTIAMLDTGRLLALIARSIMVAISEGGISVATTSLPAAAILLNLVNTVIGNTNQIVHQLLEKSVTPYPVLLTLFRRANGTVMVSIRSRGGQALAVAEKLQGGGHPNASGATLPRSVQNIPDAVVYLRQLLNPKETAPLNNLESLFNSLESKR